MEKERRCRSVRICRWSSVVTPTGLNGDAGLLLGLEDLGQPADGRHCGASARRMHADPDFLSAADVLISLFL